MPSARILLVGDHDPRVTAHAGVNRSLELLAGESGGVEWEWPGTGAIGRGEVALAEFDGIWCVPASPYRSTEGALAAIRFARENDVPFLGTCGGFQHAVLEYARNVLGRAGAAHQEMDPGAADLVLTRLSCSLVEVSGTVRLREGSRTRAIVGRAEITEGYHCNYGIGAGFRAELERGPLRVAGVDEEGDPRVVELDGHPFFIATLFQPERAALSGEPHPLVRAFLAASAAND